MNIYVLSDSPAVAAHMLCDAHVVNGPVQCVRIAAAVWRWFKAERRLQGISYPEVPVQHPCVRWVIHNVSNHNWFEAYALQVCHEYERRFKNRPAPWQQIIQVCDAPAALRKEPMTPFTQRMPERYRVPQDAVAAYRAYYLGEKMHFARWRHTEPPYWLPKNYR
jgi:hypothetical protein